jgi:prepilin-type N-terminal cleavage/methylation domain-containing protein
MKTSSSRGRGGLTVVELLVALAIAAILFLAVGYLYVAFTKGFQMGSRKLVAQREASLLSGAIGRRVRQGASFTVYVMPDRGAPGDSGDGLTILDAAGKAISRIEWSEELQTLVDSSAARMSSMQLTDVVFVRDPAEPRTLLYRYRVEDGEGSAVAVESAASLRN